LGLLQHGGWVLSANIPKGIGRSCKASYNVASEVLASGIQLVKQVTKASLDSKGGEQ